MIIIKVKRKSEEKSSYHIFALFSPEPMFIFLFQLFEQTHMFSSINKHSWIFLIVKVKVDISVVLLRIIAVKKKTFQTSAKKSINSKMEILVKPEHKSFSVDNNEGSTSSILFYSGLRNKRSSTGFYRGGISSSWDQKEYSK